MPDLTPVTVETLARMSRELTSPVIPDAQLPPVAAMLNSLAGDMADFRRASLGEAEPVMLYRSEVGS
jgi:hypothetical protein